MRRIETLFALALLPFVLLACTVGLKEEATKPAEEIVQETPPTLPPEELVTRNVTYTGLLEQGGITIYQQGTHRLTLSDGKMVLLEPSEGSAIVLNLYEGKLVRVRGDVMPTVEAGGTLMQVKGIEWIRREKDAEGKEAEVYRTLCGVGALCPDGFFCRLEETGGICIEEESEETEKSGEAGEEVGEEREMKEDKEEVQGVGEAEETEEPSDISAAEPQVTVMAEEDLAAERWTQQYCSAHIGFCIPVHKNWYYKSFGATSSVLWHVEVGMEPVENLGDGEIIVDLKMGDLSSLGVTDGAVSENSGKVVGYRVWSDNRHFEISADASLKDAVDTITKGLKTSE